MGSSSNSSASGCTATHSCRRSTTPRRSRRWMATTWKRCLGRASQPSWRARYGGSWTGRTRAAMWPSSFGVDTGLVAHLGGVDCELRRRAGGRAAPANSISDASLQRPRRTTSCASQCGGGCGTFGRSSISAVQPYRPVSEPHPLPDVRTTHRGASLSAGPAEFAEFFPPLTEEEATAAIGPYEHGRAPYRAGAELGRAPRPDGAPGPGDDGRARLGIGRRLKPRTATSRDTRGAFNAGKPNTCVHLRDGVRVQRALPAARRRGRPLSSRQERHEVGRLGDAQQFVEGAGVRCEEGDDMSVAPEEVAPRRTGGGRARPTAGAGRRDCELLARHVPI